MQDALLPVEQIEERVGLLLRLRPRLLLDLLLRRELLRRTRYGLLRRRALLRDRRRRRRFRRIRLRADDGLQRPFAVGQPNIVDRMLDAVQAGAGGEHPAGENPLHFALQRDLVDLDKGVGVGGLRRRPCIAGVCLHAQRAELHGLADVGVEIDDAPGDLVEAGKGRLLVDDLAGGRLGDHLVTGLQGGRRARHAFGLFLPRQRIGRRRRDRNALTRLPRLRRRDRNAGGRILRNDTGSRRRRQWLRLHRSRRRYALPRGRTIGRRQQTALRQLRHFLVVVRLLLLDLLAAGNIARRARRRIGIHVAEL